MLTTLSGAVVFLWVLPLLLSLLFAAPNPTPTPPGNPGTGEDALAYVSEVFSFWAASLFQFFAHALGYVMLSAAFVAVARLVAYFVFRYLRPATTIARAAEQVAGGACSAAGEPDASPSPERGHATQDLGGSL